MNHIRRRSLHIGVTLSSLFAVACAVPPPRSAPFGPLERASGKTIMLTSNANFSLGIGPTRTLRAGIRWELCGRIDLGEVFRSAEQTMTVEGYDVHEAFPVIHDSTLVGMYLPDEKTFTPVSRNVPLSMEVLEARAATP